MARGREDLVVRRERSASHRRTVSFERGNLFAVAHVPELDGRVFTRGREDLTVVGECRIEHPVLVTFERRGLFLVGDGPQLDRAIVSGRRQELAVGRECDGPDRRRVSLELGDRFAIEAPYVYRAGAIK